MNEGLHRTDVPYVWPATLNLDPPARPSMYLDLNHWIGLAQARTGKPEGQRYEPLLTLCSRHAANGTATFPLSGQHYMEMSGIRDFARRHALAAVMAELSGFTTLLCRSLVMRLELEAVLDLHVRPRPEPYAPLDMFGVGFGRAFGIDGTLNIKSAAGATSEQIREEWPGGPEAHDRTLAEMRYLGEWMMLRGPADDDMPDLLANGFDASAARQGQERRAQQEREQAARFNDDPRWRRGRIRDVVAARYLVVELGDILNEGLSARSATFDDLDTGDRNDVRALVDAMPSGDVHVGLQVALHRNPQSKWKPNDYFDIDALALAVPYCDIVVCDKQRAHDLTWTDAPARQATTVVYSPEAAADALA